MVYCCVKRRQRGGNNNNNKQTARLLDETMKGGNTPLRSQRRGPAGAHLELGVRGNVAGAVEARGGMVARREAAAHGRERRARCARHRRPQRRQPASTDASAAASDPETKTETETETKEKKEIEAEAEAEREREEREETMGHRTTKRSEHANSADAECCAPSCRRRCADSPATVASVASSQPTRVVHVVSSDLLAQCGVAAL